MNKDYHLICKHPFDHHVTGKKYTKGLEITDAAEIASLLLDKDHHFIRITAPAVAAPDPEVAVAVENEA